MAGLLQQISTPEQWQDWAQGKLDTASLPECKPALSFLPPMQRRRLGKAARLVCDAAWSLADQYPESVPVYVSHDGESNRSFELWQELLNTQYRIADLIRPVRPQRDDWAMVDVAQRHERTYRVGRCRRFL